ncbi:unnamed protein product [Aphanomyces euteiches]|uniref:5'-3' exoribonuclease n=1 Tax=Aphanomyces euteiches TaxID=100861 RepID=A0A6G0XS87_9STRA|nr:hypothetical protein Ae201684_001828 [Aphanomyces euteiches]KAH9089539.1 hypothetical protein Ae201684P_007708 [Aphanomyces euteiches]KAH9146391.1 hypothetical protein AeRB84_009761 [Aphanomyces euteiches]KAH9149942.1 hypothetical protein AeRB84_007134 [Aphanomyces euteiches]
MGVPAFYRWLSEKYPRTVVDAVEERAVVIEGRKRFNLIDMEAPNPNGQEFDNLFIDMNGIIHPCAHPDEGEQPRTEEEMFLRLMEYVDRLVACVRPRRLLYMAIDGVAPRAKMNQQRARRFRSAQEAKQRHEVEVEVREYMELMGQKVPPKQTPWDSNVITPGTKFMAKLAKYMRFFVRDRMNNCPMWKQFKVVFSDASVPGEGEHKLMSYIRTQRSQPGYDPNQHHVLHGLDADLIMLGLATHEVKFSVLREEVLFGRAKYEKEKRIKLDANGVADAKRKRGEFGEHDSSTTPSDMKPLQFLHISILREYLAIEFEPLQYKLPFPYDFERIVDDFVFMCFFVGNDFLPHLPCLDIRDGAVDYLILVYAKLLPSLGGYLTKQGGEVDLEKVDVLLAEVGSIEETIFQRRMVKERENAMRQAHRLNSNQRDKIMAAAAKEDAVSVKKQKGESGTAVIAPNADDAKFANMPPEMALKERIKAKENKKLEKYKEEIQDEVRLGEPGWKTRYYDDKLKAHDIETGGGREKVFQTYVEGLCWVMRYYYTGVASWQWFYPFHYAPFASDLKNIERYKPEFEIGQPFRPFEQLMGVFPADSRHAIPKPFQWLMTDPESPIIDFYPEEIPVDPNGKAMPWLWVVLLPFIDERRLLDAMDPITEKLSDAEKKRNERYGKELLFFHASVVGDHPLPSADQNQSIELSHDTFGIFGTVHYLESSDFPVGCTIPSPQASKIDLFDIPNNQCLSYHFQMPTAGSHLSVLLPGALVPEPALISINDRSLSIPNLGRQNICIVDLAGAAAGLTATRLRGGVHMPFNPTPGGWNGAIPHNNQGNRPPFRPGQNSGPPQRFSQSQYPPNARRSRSRSPPRRDFGRPAHPQHIVRPPTYSHNDRAYSQPPPQQYHQQAPPQQHRGGYFHQAPRHGQKPLAPGVPSGFGPPRHLPGAPSGFGPPRPNLDALRQGLRNMHAQRGTSGFPAPPATDRASNGRRYDR